jgi:hypothetical protein
MSLLFSSGADNYVDYGSAAVLDNLSQRTMLAWIYPTSVTTPLAQAIYAKADGTSFSAYRSFYVAGSIGSTIYVDSHRATTILKAESGTVLSNNVWQFVGGAVDEAATATDQKLYWGSLSTAVAEVPTYASQQVGSGAFGNDAAFNATLGNFSATVPQSWSRFIGRIAFFAMWNRVLTLNEIRQQQFRPYPTTGCVIFSHLGYNGTGTQANLSGQALNGTVTGATADIHVPLTAPFGGRAGWRGNATAAAGPADPLSHINGTAFSGLSHMNGIALSGVSHINGVAS